MGWTVGADLDAHRAAVEGYIAADPVGRTSQATILANLAAGVSWSEIPPVFAVHRDAQGAVDGSVVMTPPYPLTLDGDADLAGLVAALGDRPVAGVNAPVPEAEAFAAAWTADHGGAAHPVHRIHLLELPTEADLVEPEPVAGTVRAARPDDLDRVMPLVTAMRAEIGEPGSTPVEIQRDRIAAGLLHVLEVEGRLVATAQASAPAAGVSRVAGVYTAPEHRGRGCAAVVTAAATRAGFAAGAAHLCLFTDAANPTSNGVYERLGYRRRPLDRLTLRFGTG